MLLLGVGLGLVFWVQLGLGFGLGPVPGLIPPGHGWLIFPVICPWKYSSLPSLVAITLLEEEKHFVSDIEI